MVSTQSAEQVLKIIYRGLLANRINIETDPFYNEIASSAEGVMGKEVRVLDPYEINSGISARTERSMNIT